MIKVAAPSSPAVALLAPPLEAPLINKTRSSEKRAQRRNAARTSKLETDLRSCSGQSEGD